MTKTDYSSMTKDEIMAKLVETEEKMSKLEESKGKNLKVKINQLIDEGYNTIDDIATELETSHKNVSSYLTYLRKELKNDGIWIVSSKLKSGGKTYIAKVKLSELGWFTK